MSLDDVAAAMYNTRPRSIPWENLGEVGWKAEYRRMAQAAIDALDATSDCARCTFEMAIEDLVFAGEFIQTHYGDAPEQLNTVEKNLLATARNWLTDDTITRCLDNSLGE